MKNKSIERQNQYHIAYMNMAIAMAQLSHAVRKKVGCIIVDENDHVVAQGYNGMPAGFLNCCEYQYCDKFKKGIHDISADECSAVCDTCEFCRLKTKKEVLHAETNAIAKCAKSTDSTLGCTLYVTLSPCIDCAKTIIQSGISNVFYLEEYKDTSGIDLLLKAGITVTKLNTKSSCEYNSPTFLYDNI